MTEFLSRTFGKDSNADDTSVNIDAWLTFYAAAAATAMTFLSTDDAMKAINITVLFWMKLWFGSSAAGTVALKAFRSNTYGDRQKQKQAEKVANSGGTAFYTELSRTPGPVPPGAPVTPMTIPTTPAPPPGFEPKT